jgi:cytochrome P450
MHPTRLRTRFLLDVGRFLIFPSVVLSFILQVSRLKLGLLTVPVHASFIILWATVRGLYLNYLHSQEAKRLSAKPIPCIVGKWPGNLDILLKMMRGFKNSYVLDVYLDLFKEYQCTTLNTRILWVDHIITMDQEHSKFVLATGFPHFWRGHAQKERMETLLGGGIFNRDDQEWKFHRTLARPFFSRERVADFDIFERHTARTLAILSSQSSNGLPCEAQDLYGRFTLDAASEFLFGENLNTLSAALPTPGRVSMGPKGSATHDSWGSFASAFEMAQQVITMRGRLGYFWPFFELFNDKSEPHVKAVREWLDPIVRRIVEDKAHSCSVPASPVDKSFLQHLADSIEGNGDALLAIQKGRDSDYCQTDTTVIRDQLLNMLLASRDTAACLLTYVTYFMATHPEVAKKLRSEVLEHCGSQGTPTYESIRKLKYMRAVINETLRLFPPVPLNVRECRSDACALPPSDPTYQGSNSDDRSRQAWYMPGGTVIMYFPLLTQRNPALWGDDADVFDPERWIQPDRLAKITANPMMFTPFSAGPRICLGQNYAYNEASYFLVRLLQQFDTFTLVPELQPEGSLPPSEWRNGTGRQKFERVWPAAAMTLYVKGGMWIRFGKS